MRMYDIIEKKRDGHTLSEKEIEFVVHQYTNKQIPDYQMSALLMAIYFQGMTIEESAVLTMAMVHSGETIDLSPIHGIKVDKHSTGGVGDTTTLVLAPLVASLDIPVAKMSGRGLGHTGGTLDKLEAIDGFHIEITNEDFIHLVNQNKIAVIGQSDQLAPADKLLYSLRDVTATVNSIPLIASSIMSKKIASGADAIVLDVKVGTGAFMKTVEEARKLAETMVQIGTQVGRQTTAIISSMEEPLGNAIGNANEIREAIETLKGEGPDDLTELSLQLGAEMVVLANSSLTKEEAKTMLEDNINNGKALDKFKLFIEAQGGSANVVDHVDLLPSSKHTIEVKAEKEGYITEIVANEIGKAAMMLGAGRETKDSIIDLAVGLELQKKVGDYVKKDETICVIQSNDEDVQAVEAKIKENIVIDTDYKQPDPLIFDIVRPSSI